MVFRSVFPNSPTYQRSTKVGGMKIGRSSNLHENPKEQMRQKPCFFTVFLCVFAYSQYFARFCASFARFCANVARFRIICATTCKNCAKTCKNCAKTCKTCAKTCKIRENTRKCAKITVFNAFLRRISKTYRFSYRPPLRSSETCLDAEPTVWTSPDTMLHDVPHAGPVSGRTH